MSCERLEVVCCAFLGITMFPMKSTEAESRRTERIEISDFVFVVRWLEVIVKGKIEDFSPRIIAMSFRDALWPFNSKVRVL